MEWVVRYSLTITWRSAENSPVGAVRYQTVVSAGRLRQLVDKARADVHVISVRYHTVRRLDGAPPEQCPAGHPYPTGYLDAARACRGWIPCQCGGHHTRVCLHRGCLSSRWIGPDPDDDVCTPEVLAWITSTPEQAAAAAARRVSAMAQRRTSTST
ncbi:hypothetical protein ACFFX1_10425 [Dactylosporangium sucinum]|uniref:Uncharacterized protein n=1 Tax=Dactylosporangium sucinum TaxID=1424081 RepID=A0A917THQ6_9ACTN|nr:hypothetical protein [Dactylosporangium sucinum]GGM23644.1 hypothetical protein GCM10007977_026030 [Dactylosporangium sucinum]